MSDPRDDARFRLSYGRWALVAGASEGIGRAFAQALAARGLDLVLIARREAPLAALADELRSAHQIQTLALPLDLAASDLRERVLAGVGDREIGLLVYNACYSEIGEFLETSLASKLLTVDVNCRGPLVLLDAFAPPMVERGRGGVILMSSLSGYQGTAMVGTYAATKAFTTILGEALWDELGRKGIDVLVCAAGATYTPGFESQTPESRRRRAAPMPADAVAAEALAALGQTSSVIPGRLNRAVQALTSRLLPRDLAVRFFSSQTRKIYEP